MIFQVYNKYFYPGIFLFCCLVFLVHFTVSGQAVYGDGIGYYAHLRSWVIDGDWDYTNEYKHLYNRENNNATNPDSTDTVQIVATTKGGRAENHYSTGVAVMLLPLYVCAHLIAVLFELPATGYGDVYQIAVGIGAIIYVTAGMLLLEQILSYKISNRHLSRLTLGTLFFSTQLLYYGSFDVLNSHFASFFLMALFSYIFIVQKPSLKNIFLLGLVSGLLAVNRLQDGVVILLWLLWLASGYKQFPVLELLVKAFVYLFGALLALSSLLYHWYLTYGTILPLTYLRNLENDLGKTSVDWVGSLFHPVTGLFSKAPLLLILLLYFFWQIKPKKEKILLLFFFFVVQYLIISIQGGWYAAAYGGRMYTSSLVFFALLLIDFFKELQRKGEQWPIVVSALFSVSGITSFGYFILFQKP